MYVVEGEEFGPGPILEWVGFRRLESEEEGRESEMVECLAR